MNSYEKILAEIKEKTQSPECSKVLAKYPADKGWTLGIEFGPCFKNTSGRWGNCESRKIGLTELFYNEITISEVFAEHATEDDLREVFIHEIAHAVSMAYDRSLWRKHQNRHNWAFHSICSALSKAFYGEEWATAHQPSTRKTYESVTPFLKKRKPTAIKGYYLATTGRTFNPIKRGLDKQLGPVNRGGIRFPSVEGAGYREVKICGVNEDGSANPNIILAAFGM